MVRRDEKVNIWCKSSSKVQVYSIIQNMWKVLDGLVKTWSQQTDWPLMFSTGGQAVFCISHVPLRPKKKKKKTMSWLFMESSMIHPSIQTRNALLRSCQWTGAPHFTHFKRRPCSQLFSRLQNLWAQNLIQRRTYPSSGHARSGHFLCWPWNSSFVLTRAPHTRRQLI